MHIRDSSLGSSKPLSSISANLRTHQTHALKAAVDSPPPISQQRSGSYAGKYSATKPLATADFRTIETHALKAYATIETHALKASRSGGGGGAGKKALWRAREGGQAGRLSGESKKREVTPAEEPPPELLAPGKKKAPEMPPGKFGWSSAEKQRDVGSGAGEREGRREREGGAERERARGAKRETETERDEREREASREGGGGGGRGREGGREADRELEDQPAF